MGAGTAFADVLLARLADVPLPVARGGAERWHIASPSWVHRLEPLRAVSAPFLHLRYSSPASAAPATGGIPVGDGVGPLRGGSKAIVRPRRRGYREQVAIALLNRFGACLTDGASDADVRSAYRRLVREVHPDMHPDAAAADRAANAARLRAVIRAWHLFQGPRLEAA